MALGTITQLNVNPRMSAAEPQGIDQGPLKMIVSQFTGDTSYPTGGTSLTPSQLGFGTDGVIYFAYVQISASSGSNDAAIDGLYNLATNKLQMLAAVTPAASYTQNAAAAVQEAANTSNLSGLTLQVCAFGTPGA